MECDRKGRADTIIAMGGIILALCLGLALPVFAATTPTMDQHTAANPLNVTPAPSATQQLAEGQDIGATLLSVEPDVIMSVAPTSSATWLLTPGQSIGTTLISVEPDVLMSVAPKSSATWMLTPGQSIGTTLISVEPDVIMSVAPTSSATWLLTPGQSIGTTLISVEPDVLMTVAPLPGSTWLTVAQSANLTVTATGAADLGITLTLPAVAAHFHRVGFVSFIKYVTGSIAANATPVVVSTTNLRSTAYTFRNTGSKADLEEILLQPNFPFRSETLNTDTTFVFPATTGIKWIAVIQYQTGPQ
jgi:hypothetical protein